MVRSMLDAGYAVASGARFRIASAPAVRITTAALPERRARRRPRPRDGVHPALGTYSYVVEPTATPQDRVQVLSRGAEFMVQPVPGGGTG